MFQASNLNRLYSTVVDFLNSTFYSYPHIC